MTDGEKKLREQEFRAKIDAANREYDEKEKKQTQVSDKFAKLESLRHNFDITKKIIPTEYIAGVFPRGYISAIIGHSGVGKTILEQRLFSDLSKGGEILTGSYGDEIKSFSYEEKPRKSVVITGEFREDGMIERAKTFDFFDADKNFVEVIDAFDFEQEGFSFMLDKEDGKQNIEYIAKSKPDIMFFDSFGTLYSGKESDNDELFKVLRFLMRIAKDYNIAVVIIHHSRKRLSGEQQRPLTLDDMIGGNAIARCVALVMAIEFNLEHNVNIVRCLKSWRKYFKPFTYAIKTNIYKNGNYLDIDLKPDFLQPEKLSDFLTGKKQTPQTEDKYTPIKIFLEARGEQGGNAEEIAEALNREKNTVYSQLSRMYKYGDIIKVQRPDKKRGYYALAKYNSNVSDTGKKTEAKEHNSNDDDNEQYDIDFND